MSAGTFSVGTSITPMFSVGAGYSITIKNVGPATVWLDFQASNSSSITADQSSTGGFPLDPGEKFTNPPISSLYYVLGITAEGTTTVSVIG